MLFDSVFFQYEEWNAHDKLLLGYIKTKASPPIFYLPAEHTSKTEALLKETQSAIEGKINCLTIAYYVHVCNIVYFIGKITERQKEVESFLSEGKDTKMEDSFQEEVEGEGDMDTEERGRGRREGSASGDGSDKEQ